MATVNLLPNGDISNSPAWTLSTGSDVFALIDDDDTGNPASDGSQINTTAAGKKCVIQFQDFDNTDVASIDSVQAVLKVGQQGRGNTYTIGMTITNNGSGSADWPEETINDTASFSWNTNTFTARPYANVHPSEPAWTDTDIDNITMEIHAHTMSGDTLRVTYAYFIVTYTEAVAAVDNATFFGTNF